MTETKVSDLQLAAYLMARDYPLLRVEGDSGRKMFVLGEVSDEALFAYY